MHRTLGERWDDNPSVWVVRFEVERVAEKTFTTELA
jgi:hypothetical protein